MQKSGWTCFLFFMIVGFTSPSPAATFRDDFDSAKLNGDVWEVAKAGKGGYSVKDGQLFVESPAVPDGAILYFRQELKGDIVVECKMDPSKVDPGTLGAIGFTDGIFPPEPSPGFWVHWLAHFNYGPTNSTAFVDDYPGKNGFPKAGDTFNYQSEPHVWKLVIKGESIAYLFDDKEIGGSDTLDVPRYFHVSPDNYTSHYFGTVAIDYVTITGDSVKAVSSSGKSAVAWGSLKSLKSLKSFNVSRF